MRWSLEGGCVEGGYRRNFFAAQLPQPSRDEHTSLSSNTDEQ